VRDDENLRFLVLGARRELASKEFHDRESGAAGANVEAAECYFLAVTRTRDRQRGRGIAISDDRVLVQCAKCLGQLRESRSQEVSHRVGPAVRDLACELRVESANDEIDFGAAS
jgi:hypothetical protein